MPVSFNTIPSTMRAPLFYAEMDNSKAGTYQATYRALLIGQITNVLFPDVNKPTLISSLAQAKSKFGNGSQIAQMFDGYFENNTSVEVYALPISDPDSGAAARGTFTVSGTATAAGTLTLYIYDESVQVGIAEGDEAADVAESIAAAINADVDLPVTAEASEAAVTVTAKHKGIIGNDIILGLNRGGEANGEETPAGLTVTISDMTGGSGNPDVEEAE